MAVSTSYRLTPELKQRLARRATTEGITVTALISRLLAQGLAAKIPAFVDLYYSINKHRAGIIASVTHGLSNGLTESVNTKLRLLTRIAYGFKNTDALIALCYPRPRRLQPTPPGRTQ